MSTDKDVFWFSEFDGLRNTVDPEEMSPADLVAAVNVDITDSKRIRRRSGFGPAVVAGSCHSLWSNGSSAFVVAGTDLLEVLPDFTTRTLRTGLTPLARMAFEQLGHRVFFSNGFESGVIEDGAARDWGFAAPPLPAVAVVAGSLQPGRYQYATTYVDAYDQESGAGRAGVIDIQEPAGLAFSGFGEVPNRAARLNLYLSQPNGELLYLVESLHRDSTATVVSAPTAAVVPLATQFLAPAPAGEHIAYSYGRMYVARGARVYVSEPYAPELFDLRKGYMLESAVTMLAPIFGGLLVGTENEVGWIDGAEPDKAGYVHKAPHGVIPGTLAYGPTDDYAEAGGVAAYFATDGGIMRASPGGQLVNLTRARYQYPRATDGAGVVRVTNGISQYLAVLRG